MAISSPCVTLKRPTLGEKKPPNWPTPVPTPENNGSRCREDAPKSPENTHTSSCGLEHSTDWDPGPPGCTLGSATDLLGDLGHVTSPLLHHYLVCKNEDCNPDFLCKSALGSAGDPPITDPSFSLVQHTYEAPRESFLLLCELFASGTVRQNVTCSCMAGNPQAASEIPQTGTTRLLPNPRPLICPDSAGQTAGSPRGRAPNTLTLRLAYRARCCLRSSNNRLQKPGPKRCKFVQHRHRADPTRLNLTQEGGQRSRPTLVAHGGRPHACDAASAASAPAFAGAWPYRRPRWHGPSRATWLLDASWQEECNAPARNNTQPFISPWLSILPGLSPRPLLLAGLGKPWR